MTKVRYVCKCECGLQVTCLPHAPYTCVDMLNMLVLLYFSYLPPRMLVTSCQNEFQFHTSTWQDNSASVSLPPSRCTLLHPAPLPAALALCGTEREREGERRRKNECLRVYAMRLPGASPGILRPAPSPLCWSTLPAPLGTLENVTKILYWCLLLLVVVGALFLYFISFFSAFLMMLLKAIHKISHTATHNGNRSSRKRGGQGGGVTKYVWIRRKSWKRRIIQFGSVPFGTHSRIYFIIAPRRMLLKCRHKCVGWAPTHPHTNKTVSHKRTHTW